MNRNDQKESILDSWESESTQPYSEPLSQDLNESPESEFFTLVNPYESEGGAETDPKRTVIERRRRKL